ncbi:hypothetical protein M422DRAFT_248383 [Sphaerobolus stellatus SS14]|uniref:Uncharacterized protein n=1 Tax=Sphaerobolus stellatus (strain SS14) TaxID=990650 RepID=A0A0C9UVX7_SPHS4|nr:hypothetical protein M422DRAFT_248383 [Sphaerobolus stellatus SS14]
MLICALWVDYNATCRLLAEAVLLRSEQKNMDLLQSYESSECLKRVTSDVNESVQNSSQEISQKMDELKPRLNAVVAKLVRQDIWTVVSSSNNTNMDFLEKLAEVVRRLQRLETAAQRLGSRISGSQPGSVQYRDIGISTDPTLNVEDLQVDMRLQVHSAELLVNDAANNAGETIADIWDDIRLKLKYFVFPDVEAVNAAEVGRSAAKPKKSLRDLAVELQNNNLVFEDELASVILTHGHLESRLSKMCEENRALREQVSEYQKSSSVLEQRISRNGKEIKKLRAIVAEISKLQEQQTTQVHAIDEQYFQHIRSQVTQQVIAGLAPILENYNGQVTSAMQMQRQEISQEILKRMSDTSLLITNSYNNVMHKFQSGSSILPN